MAVCLSQKLVERYVAGNCSQDQARTIEEHLGRCESCRQRMNSARQIHVRESDRPTVSITDTSVTAYAPQAIDPSLASAIEGYELLERLPAGGQAVVYKAFQKATKRIVAVKVLLQELHASERAQYRFEREVDLAASLRHPNIVTIYDSGIAQGQYYYAMEYIEGKPLDKYVQAGQLSTREVMELFNKICSAVAYAHQRGVMHRDLKPGNILVDADGRPHILDFGLAKLTDSSEQATPEAVMTSIPGKIIGTLAFMSPEQASGNPTAIDVRTDVYSIGVILYRVLTNDFPYEITGSMLGILRNIQEVEPARPSILVGNLNSEIEAIVLKALAKEPQLRYQSAAELGADISNWLEGLPISAKADSSIYVLRKLLARHRYATAVAGLVLVIILGFSFFSFDRYWVTKGALEEKEVVIKRLVAESRTNLAYAQQRAFIVFLDAWHKGPRKVATEIADYFTRNLKEDKAVRFLLDPRPLSEKERQFRQELQDNARWFLELVISEHHLKNGNRSDALKGYQRSYEEIIGWQKKQLREERLLADQIEDRLEELTSPEETVKDETLTKPGD